MKVLRVIMIVLIFVSIVAGFVLVFGAGLFVSKKKNTADNVSRKTMRLKLIGYVLLMLSFALAIFQSFITV